MATSGGDRVRIGVIGLGLVGQVVHLPNLARLGDAFVVSHISDLSATTMRSVAATLPGTPRRSLDAAVVVADPQLDAVLLLTPGAHAPLAEAALRAGKHVLSEKPLCVSQAEAARLGRLAEEHGLVLQVAYMKAYDPAVPKAREVLERIGRIRLVSVEVRHPSHENQVARLGYRRAADADGAIIAAAEAAEATEAARALGQVPPGIDRLYRRILLGSVVHELSALRSLGFAPPTSWAHAMVWPFDPAEGEAAPPSIAATAEWAEGTILRLQWLWLPDYPRYEERISIIGETGALELEMPQPYGPNVAARLRVRGPDDLEVVVEDGRQRRDSGFLEELRVFHAAVTKGAAVPTGASEAQADTASLQALARAIAARYDIALAGEAAGPGR